MPPGFFAKNNVQPNVVRTVAACGACGLHLGCNSPRMPVTGDGQHGVLIVAEAPGETEDEEGVQLVGKAGKFLRRKISQIGYDLDRDCWKTNAIICHPKKNRTPTKAEIDYCRPNLLNTMRALKPRVIILLGGAAVEAVVGHLRKSGVGSIGTWVGWQIPCQKPNVWICPTWHPSYLLREEDDVLELWFERHLESAFDIVGRPWPGPQNWEKDIQILDSDAAAAKLMEIACYQTGAVAFDYETTTLKPDTPESEIVTCSVAWGRTEPEIVIAYPWHGKAIGATQELLRSPLPKIASNMKFEDRWTRMAFGHRVRNWVHDTMLFAHLMDNRPGITGLKFQAFVHLGFPDYDGHIKPYLASGGTRSKNRVLELDRQELLKYNGLDALLEFRLACRQLQIQGYDYPWRTK